MPRRRKGRDIDGVFLLDKACGISSNDALQQVRRALNARKAGHTGSLDPLATGLLPICLGEATKLAGYLLEAPKSYRVTAAIGIATDTGDAEGAITEQGTRRLPDIDTLDAVLRSFEGEQRQTPPMYAALKYQGRPLYEYARAGQTVPLESRAIRVARIERVALDDGDLTLDVDVSAGTYVRRLVEDMALAMGRVAHVAELRRVAVGALGTTNQPMHSVEALRDCVDDQPDGGDYCIAPSALLADWPTVTLDEPTARAFQNGRAVHDHALSASGPTLYRIHDPSGALIAIGALAEHGDGALWPKRVFTRPQS